MRRLGTMLLSVLLSQTGCGYKCVLYPYEATPPGTINHVVFFDLKDPADAGDLIQDCYGLLDNPIASSGYAGKHYDIGRATVLQDYDVCFFVAFDSEEDYRAYIEHPRHVALVEKWKPRWDSIRVYDIGDARSLERAGDQ